MVSLSLRVASGLSHPRQYDCFKPILNTLPISGPRTKMVFSGDIFSILVTGSHSNQMVLKWLEMILENSSRGVLDTKTVLYLQHMFLVNILFHRFDPNTSPKIIKLLLEKGVLGKALVPTDPIELDDEAFKKQVDAIAAAALAAPVEVSVLHPMLSDSQWIAIRRREDALSDRRQRQRARREMVRDFRDALRRHARNRWLQNTPDNRFKVQERWIASEKRSARRMQKERARKQQTGEATTSDPANKTVSVIGTDIGDAVVGNLKEDQSNLPDAASNDVDMTDSDDMEFELTDDLNELTDDENETMSDVEYMMSNDGTVGDAIARIDHFFASLLEGEAESSVWEEDEALPVLQHRMSWSEEEYREWKAQQDV